MAVMAVAAISANAQVYVGGGVGFNVVKVTSDSKNATSYTFLPEIGYKLNDKVDFGAEIGFSLDGNALQFGINYEF